MKLDYDDLGREFYKSLTATSGLKLFDFNNLQNNSFNVTTELTCKNGDEEFRPDVTVLINGMPLIFKLTVAHVLEQPGTKLVFPELDLVNRF